MSSFLFTIIAVIITYWIGFLLGRESKQESKK